MSYTSGSHTVFHHRYHIVWITKYRYKVLEGALREGYERLSGRCAENWASRSYPHFVARTCPYVRGNPATYCRQRLRAARQGTVVASGADGVPGLAQALLGAAFLGSGLSPPRAATSRTMSYFSIFRSTNLPASAGSYSEFDVLDEQPQH